MFTKLNNSILQENHQKLITLINVHISYSSGIEIKN